MVLFVSPILANHLRFLSFYLIIALYYQASANEMSSVKVTVSENEVSAYFECVGLSLTRIGVMIRGSEIMRLKALGVI